ncbi:TVP38/TMEM64 family protein [Pedobacter glucosidilyticus]|uniref:TVP38/TMEM64 family protein n=1 Tax=Pedobacter glucosidilyticus TaxID=1122941 RepID=UPI000414B8FB|nr:VTT domain-containing protein [Pedobacter glucosidilyticus]
MKEKEQKTSFIPLIISGVVIAVILLCYFLIPEVRNFMKEAYTILTSDDTARIRNWVSTFGLWGPIVLILAMVIQLFLMVIPSVIIMVIAVLAYGPWLGSLITLAGIISAASIGYIVGDYLGDVGVEKLIGEKALQKIETFFKTYGLWTIIVFRASPFLSNDAISFVGGFVEMTYKRFIIATILGSAPLLILVAVFGQSIDQLKPGLIIASIISVIGLIIYIYMDKKKIKKKNSI